MVVDLRSHAIADSLRVDTLPVEAAMNMNEELLQQRFMHNILLIVDRSVAPTMSVLKTDSPFSTSDDL